MKYSAEEFSRAGDQFLGRSYEDMDCQELVERMMASVGYKRDLGGSNSWYRECLKNGWVGTPEECLKEFGVIPKGAILFICEPVSASTPAKFRDDGVGDITHMGVKTGRGDGAIHSSSSKGCVCSSVFKDRTIRNGGWNRVGLLNVFSYENPVDWVLKLGVQRNGGDGSAVPHSRNGQNNSTFHRLHPPLAAASETPPVPQDVQEEKERKPMKGTVTAQSGKTVKLRQKPSTDCPIYWDIPIGTELLVVDQREKWSKCICGGLTGWMKNEFIQTEQDEDMIIAPEPDVREDFSDEEEPATAPGDILSEAKDFPDSDEALTLLTEVYGILKDLCERILSVVGRG